MKIPFDVDNGSAFTLIALEAVTGLGFEVDSLPTGFPNVLRTAEGLPTLKVLGLVHMHLQGEHQANSYKVDVLVVERLYCNALLGRNVLDLMAEGKSSLPRVGAIPMQPGELEGLIHLPLVSTDEQKLLAKESLSNFRFAEHLEAAGTADAEAFKIVLKGNHKPCARRNYPMSREEEDFADGQIKSWLANGTIVPSSSEWVSPLVVARHPRSSKLRLCVDFRKINSMSEGDAYLMPLIGDIAKALKGKTVFSKLDLVQGFGQLPVHQQSRKYTAFRGVRGGLYEFAACPFGLKNIPAVFQRFMDGVLGDMLWKSASIYIDDCIVFSSSIEDHHRHLAELAKRFAEHNIVVRASKCVFYASSVEYLGFLFDGKSRKILPERVQTVLECQVPSSRDELRKFLGLTGQFRTFIVGYADIAAPLEQMKHKLSKVNFDLSQGSEGWSAFHKLRDALVRMPELFIPDMNLPFIGYADASFSAMGFALCQKQGDMEVPVAFYSKAFDKKQLGWSNPIKEAAALRHFVMNQAYPYLATGGPHTIFVDNLAAHAILSNSLKDPKLIRMAVDLSGMPLNIKLISGSKNVADCFTKLPFFQPDPALRNLLFENPLRNNQGWKEAVQQVECVELDHVASLPQAGEVKQVAVVPSDNIERSDGVVLKFVRKEHILEHQKQDEEIQKIVGFIKAGRPSGEEIGFSDAAREYSRKSKGLVVENDGLVVRLWAYRGRRVRQIVIPVSLQDSFLQHSHIGPVARVSGCRHGQAMFELLKQEVWWDGLLEACRAFSCAVCARQKAVRMKPAGHLHATTARRPGEVLSMDLVPMSQSQGYKGFAILTCKFSGYVNISLFRDKPNAKEAVEMFDAMCNPLFVDVRELWIDADAILKSVEFQEAMERRGVEVKVAFPRHQQSNFVERAVQHVKQMLRTSLDGLPTNRWAVVLKDVVKCMNLTYNSSKSCSPYQILTGWAPPNFMPYLASCDTRILGYVFDDRKRLWDLVEGAMEDAVQKQEKQYNYTRSDYRFVKGDVVLRKLGVQEVEDGHFNLSPKYDPNPFIVEEVLSEVSLLIRSFERDSITMEVHISALRPAITEEFDPRLVRPDTDGSLEQQYVVQKIHNHRFVSRNREDIEYLVEWGGFRDARTYTWEPKNGLETSAGDILKRYNDVSPDITDNITGHTANQDVREVLTQRNTDAQVQSQRLTEENAQASMQRRSQRRNRTVFEEALWNEVDDDEDDYMLSDQSSD